MNLPQQLTDAIQNAIGDEITAVAAVGGGCISNTARVALAAQSVAFLKWGATSEFPLAFFREEARSLDAMAATNTVRVPRVLHQSSTDGHTWLLLEWLEPGARTPRSQSQLGERLAALHRSTAERYGWPADNFIGSLPQSNTEHERWSDFWRDERLLPQLDQAAGALGAKNVARLERIANECAELLAGTGADGPSLLHGDLWGGNLHTLADGAPALIDPSSYYGHREVDLAMSRLFGGFSEEFYRAYQQAWPCAGGLEQRIRVYQLYYLLVHVNLFGGGYTAQTMSVAGALGF